MTTPLSESSAAQTAGPSSPSSMPRWVNAPAIADLLSLDDAGFRSLFSGSPVKRIGRDRFVRNALIAAGNSGLDALAPRCEALIADPEPVVRGAAIWALSCLRPAKATALARDALPHERDAGVKDEWNHALEAAG